MALVSCKECGKEVSDSALICPGCGIAAPALTTTQKKDVVALSNLARSAKLGMAIFLGGAGWVALTMFSGAGSEAVSVTWSSSKWMIGGGALWYIIAEIDRNLAERKIRQRAAPPPP